MCDFITELCKKDKVTGTLKNPVSNITLYYELFRKFSSNSKNANTQNIKISYANKELVSNEINEKIRNSFLRSYGGNENYSDAESIMHKKNK